MKKYLICDFDSTIVFIETVDELAKFVMHKSTYDVDVIQEIEQITELGMRGEISFAESLGRRLSLISLDKEDIQAFTAYVRKSLTMSVYKHRDFISKHAEQFHIVSGGFRDFIVPVAHDLGIDASHVHANSFLFDADGRVTGYETSSNLTKPHGKAVEIASLNLPGYVVMVGDGWTDYEVKQQGAAARFVAFVEHAMRENVMAHADFIAHHFDDVVNYFKKI